MISRSPSPSMSNSLGGLPSKPPNATCGCALELEMVRVLDVVAASVPGTKAKAARATTSTAPMANGFTGGPGARCSIRARGQNRPILQAPAQTSEGPLAHHKQGLRALRMATPLPAAKWVVLVVDDEPDVLVAVRELLE